jgi:uncharacterized membrane protein
MKVQITFNKEDDNKPDNADLLHRLGAKLENELFYIELSKIEEVFEINTKLNKITNKYWNVTTGTYLDEKKIFIEIDKEVN